MRDLSTTHVPTRRLYLAIAIRDALLDSGAVCLANY